RRGSRPPTRARVVGIVADSGIERLDRDAAEQMVYLPFDPAERGGGFLLLRGRQGTHDPMRRVDAVIAEVNPLVASLDDRTLQQEHAEQMWVERRLAELFGVFAAAALALGAAGLFGVIALSVERQRRGLAIRSALGARPRDLRQRLLGEGARCIAWGLGLGGGLTWLTIRGVERFLYQVSPWDPVLLAGSAALISAVLLAAILPTAWRAGRTDPASALSTD
ncbi:MAG: hypothetical protein MI919_30460, partial [Holophagales bacterium]|nr:hypothetical protein [Holophagales bacterium]